MAINMSDENNRVGAEGADVGSNPTPRTTKNVSTCSLVVLVCLIPLEGLN